MAREAVGGLSAELGERRRGYIRVPDLEPAWEMPAVVVRGREPGPTLAVTSGMHAAEYVPIEAVTRLTRWVDPGRLRGTLIAVLIVNTPGFFERSIYVNPRDGRNLNRSFPGEMDGEPSSQVASFLLSELIDGSDAYVDAHCGDLIEALVPYTGWVHASDPTVAERSRALADAYGFEFSYGLEPDLLPGSAAVNAASHGVPAIIAEIGQQGICDELSVGRHVRGLQNVLAHLGMIDPLDTAPAPPEQLSGFVVTGTEKSGTYHPTAHVGDRVVEGAPIGVLRDLFGDTIEEFHAPATGIVLFCMTSLAVRQGDPLIGIGVRAVG